MQLVPHVARLQKHLELVLGVVAPYRDHAPLEAVLGVEVLQVVRVRLVDPALGPLVAAAGDHFGFLGTLDQRLTFDGRFAVRVEADALVGHDATVVVDYELLVELVDQQGALPEEGLAEGLRDERVCFGLLEAVRAVLGGLHGVADLLDVFGEVFDEELPLELRVEILDDQVDLLHEGDVLLVVEGAEVDRLDAAEEFVGGGEKVLGPHLTQVPVEGLAVELLLERDAG